MRSHNAQEQWRRRWIPFEVEIVTAHGEHVETYTAQTRIAAAYLARHDFPGAHTLTVAGTVYNTSGSRITRKRDGEGA